MTLCYCLRKKLWYRARLIRLFDTGRYYEMEMNVEKTKIIRLSRQPSQTQTMIGKKQMENVKYFNYLGCIKINDATCTREIKSRIAMAEVAFNKTKVFIHKLDLLLSKKQ